MLPSVLGLGASIYGSQQAANAARDANAANLEIAREQMQFSAGQAQREMDFQERMSGSAYQRGVEDMRRAGINPMLAVGNGGASSPGGAMGSSAGATMEPVPSVVANSLSSAVDVLKTLVEFRTARAQIDNLSADTLKKTAEVSKVVADTGLSKASTSAVDANRKKTLQQTNTIQMANNEIARRQAVEGLSKSGKSSGPSWIWGALDTMLSRLPLVHSATDLSKLATQ